MNVFIAENNNNNNNNNVIYPGGSRHRGIFQ